MLIDLETYRPRVSETPQIAFRRTEADRRPARVVARPNDGPGEQREQFARELAEKAMRKTVIDEPAPVRLSTRSDFYAAAQEQMRRDLLALIGQRSDGVYGLECIKVAPGRSKKINAVLIALAAEELIEREYKGFGHGILNTITDKGRAFLAAGQ